MRYAVILAGGSGTRLWPASRRDRPKQFLALGNPGESLLAATVRRLGPVCPPERIAVVTAAEQAALVRDAIPSLGPDAVIGEPAARNTAAALGLAAVHLRHRDPDAVMAALPADHHIADEPAFAAACERALAAAEAGDVIVTVGVVPTRPETGYGYMQVGAPRGDVEQVARFVEKPDAATAAEYLASGDYLWNAGMFFCSAARLLADIERHMPRTHAGLVEIAAALASGPDAADAACARVYPSLPKISIDYGVMERATDVVCVRGDFGWNDVGSWTALADYREADPRGNITQGGALVRDGARNIVVGDADRAVCVVGVSDLVVVQSGDAVLVIPRDRAQDVRDVVAALQEAGLDAFA